MWNSFQHLASVIELLTIFSRSTIWSISRIRKLNRFSRSIWKVLTWGYIIALIVKSFTTKFCSWRLRILQSQRLIWRKDHLNCIGEAPSFRILMLREERVLEQVSVINLISFRAISRKHLLWENFWIFEKISKMEKSKGWKCLSLGRNRHLMFLRFSKVEIVRSVL